MYTVYQIITNTIKMGNSYLFCFMENKKGLLQPNFLMLDAPYGWNCDANSTYFVS